jgi:hypothetical protein
VTRLINPITNPNPVSVTNTRDNIFYIKIMTVTHHTYSPLGFSSDTGNLNINLFSTLRDRCEWYDGSSVGRNRSGYMEFNTVYIVTDLMNALSGNSSVNTVPGATIDEAVISLSAVTSSSSGW